MFKRFLVGPAIALLMVAMNATIYSQVALGAPKSTTEDKNENAILSLLTPKTIFLTSETYSGDLVTAAWDLGFEVENGSEAANAICQYHADEAGLIGTYVAIISTSEIGANAMLSTSLGPYRKVNGAPVAADYAALFGTRFGVESDSQIDASPVELISSISRDEFNDVRTGPGPSTLVWTGSTGIGQIAPSGPGGVFDISKSTCNDWTTDTQGENCPVDGPCGRVGRESAINPDWIAQEARSCDQLHFLYCAQL